ncbi:MAG: acyltransferase, partial [Prevotellaceae bacterium]|nr:acyltransferase [Prevotellaceae bacterium]
MTQELYDEYRPYTDAEVPAAIERIADNVLFSEIVKYVFPDKCVNDFIAEFKQIRTVAEFQTKVMSFAIESIIDKTIDNQTYSGVENLSNDRPCMQISNHRDIVLDSAILEVILCRNGLNTSEITFGSNLMKPQIIVDIGKLNKMFKIIRGGSPRESFA